LVIELASNLGPLAAFVRHSSILCRSSPATLGYLEPGSAVTVQLVKAWELSMQSKLVAESAGQRTFIIILDPGEEAFQSISDFAVKEGFSAASLTALGAFFEATVGWFDLAERTYRKIPVAQQCEVLSAVGDIAVTIMTSPAYTFMWYSA
jgi:hypothetical protein